MKSSHGAALTLLTGVFLTLKTNRAYTELNPSIVSPTRQIIDAALRISCHRTISEIWQEYSFRDLIEGLNRTTFDEQFHRVDQDGKEDEGKMDCARFTAKRQRSPLE
ncbi:MAG: hypothetical protein KGS09_20795 [Nitrospirae bacterium]|nr:hypothetical protein [Nitrospirota bacterium]